MKIERLIGIITILLQQDKVTAPELAARFEVSRRTINRDIEAICKAGIPLVTIQGFDGGISISDSYKIDKTLFTQDELQTILTGLKGIDSVSPGTYLSGIMEKLSSRERQIVVDDTMVIDLASHYHDALTHKIGLIKNAVRCRRMISFQYYSENGESQRRIEAYRLIFKWSSWYVFGFCHSRNDYRLFKLNRLWDLSVLEEHFVPREIPEKRLDFNAYFSSHTIRLKAIFTETERHRLIDEYGRDSYVPCESGGLLFEWDFAGYQNMRQWILSFGDQVRVLEPEELRTDIRRQYENILQRYRET